MALIDLSKKEIHCKIVYYGPGRCGKTTNLLTVHSPAIMPRARCDHRNQGRSTCFRSSSLNLGTIRIQYRIQPIKAGQVVCRHPQLVLKGRRLAVADPLQVRRERNVESLEDLRTNLLEYGLKLEEMPLVIQYNKRDLVDTPIPTLTVEELDADLNSVYKVKTFEASAVTGMGVFETLREISKQTVRYVTNKHLLHETK
jgi:hypothetical protein